MTNPVLIPEENITHIRATDGIAVQDFTKSKNWEEYLVGYSYTNIDESGGEMYCDICGERYYPQPDDTLCPQNCTESSRTRVHYNEIASYVYSLIDDGVEVTIDTDDQKQYVFKLPEE